LWDIRRTETAYARETEESLLLEAVAREGLMKIQKARKGLAGAVVIFEPFSGANIGIVGSNHTQGMIVSADPPSKEFYRTPNAQVREYSVYFHNLILFLLSLVRHFTPFPSFSLSHVCSLYILIYYSPVLFAGVFVSFVLISFFLLVPLYPQL
jgi:hypothetical protein